MLANTWHKNKSHRIIYFEDLTSKPKESISCENMYESLDDLYVQGVSFEKWKFQMAVAPLGCPKMHKRWKCNAPEAKSDAKTLIFWENIKIWAVN